MLKSLHEPKASTAAFKVVHKKDQDQVKSRLSLRSIVKILYNLNINTIRINFAYFDFKTAIRFPIFVKGKVRLSKLKGTVKINSAIKPGMILLGHGHVGHFDRRSTHTIWDVDGSVVFNGNALFKNGSKIIVAKTGLLELGSNFRFSCNSALICYKKISFGNSCRVSWEVQIMDTDFHQIKTLTGEVINSPKDIIIGNHVWIGTKAMIMKGVQISEDCVVASNSVVTKVIAGNNQIIGGTPAKVIKTGITWD